MKKWLSLIATILCCATLCFGLAACDFGGGSTDNSGGGTPTHEHAFSSEWSTNETHHWHAATCEHTSEVKDKAEHMISGRECSVCGYKIPTEGLKYTLSNDSTYYSLSGIGTATVKNIVIASTYNGKPVKKIDDSAFYEYNKLVNITIPNSIESIGEYAFFCCSGLTSVSLPDSVKSIATSAFEGCAGLKHVQFGNSVESIGVAAFSQCDALQTVKLPDSVLSIGNTAFYACDNLKSVIIGNNVELIDTYTFWCCSNLTSVVIGKAVSRVGFRAFYYCNALKDVYYMGTESDWGSLEVSSENNCLINATRYYYSVEEPTDGKNYWHYGESPVIW